MQTLFLLSSLFLSLIHGHSMMTCGVLNSNNQCVGAIRNAGPSLQSTNYRFDNTNPCQPEARGVSNLAGKYSASNPMGQLSSGQTFTVQWTARNHAVNNQNPRIIQMYLSPAIASSQTDDYSWPTFRQNMFCSGPYINCGNGANVDTQGDGTPCTLTCTLPSLSNGIYTMLWHWNWTQNDGQNYMTCADFQIGGSSVTPTTQTSASISTSRTSGTTSAQSSTSRAASTAATSRASSASITQTSNTQPKQTRESSDESDTTSTNGQQDCPDLIDRCNKLCGEGLVRSCSCKNGEFSAECTSAEDSSSSVLSISSVVLFILSFFA